MFVAALQLCINMYQSFIQVSHLNSFITSIHGVKKVGQSFELGERVKSDSFVECNRESYGWQAVTFL
jgi:hypothetical protein